MGGRGERLRRRLVHTHFTPLGEVLFLYLFYE